MVLDLMFLWMILAIFLFVMVSSIIACLCGCCRKTQRDELMGLSGKVKITNPDILQNNNAPLALSITRTLSDDNIQSSSIPSSNASTKRTSTLGSNSHTGTATRSLPEIPVDAKKSASLGANTSTGNFISYVGDTNSDLYATLEEHKISSSSTKPKLTANMFGSSSQSNGTVTYEQIDENSSYNDIKEHPYAQVENDVHASVASTSRMEHDSPDSAVIPREESTSTVDIPAASAITGNIAASNELPYMTPPLHTNFSGDSQDSTKGYTSITVREPLARIRPQNTTKPVNPHVNDSHYTVLSDDSDEMYAAIQDAYTSGSETYAQIQPVASASTYNSPSNNPGSPRTSNVTQKFNEISIHSRQASTSSISSSLTNRNSPKEKRQANSPLPKPPEITPDDMYAKVLKKRKYEPEWSSSKDSMFSVDHELTSSFHSVTASVDQTISKENEDGDKYRDAGLDLAIDEVDGIGINGCYETLPERNYASLNESAQCPGYETVKEQNSGYESLPEPDSLTPGYERIRDPAGYEKLKYETLEEDIGEPNYEELRPRKESNQGFHCYATIDKKKTLSSGDIPEPDYASLTRRHEDDNWNNAEDPFYERIRKRCEDDEDADDDFDRNNNHSDSMSKNDRLTRNHSVSENNLSDLYSKVNKTKR